MPLHITHHRTVVEAPPAPDTLWLNYAARQQALMEGAWRGEQAVVTDLAALTARIRATVAKNTTARQPGDSDISPAAGTGASLYPFAQAGSPVEIWGSGSATAPAAGSGGNAGAGRTGTGQAVTATPAPQASGNNPSWQTSAIVLLLLCVYCYFLYRFRRNIVQCVRCVGNVRATLGITDSQDSSFGRFTWEGALLSVLCFSFLLTSWADRHDLLSGAGTYLVFLGSAAAFGVLILYQQILTGLIGLAGGHPELRREMSLLNRMDFTTLALVYAPLSILGSAGSTLLWIALGSVLLLLLYHAAMLWGYFRLRLFSNFQFILYLCTVEILPVSFAMALAVR